MVVDLLHVEWEEWRRLPDTMIVEYLIHITEQGLNVTDLHVIGIGIDYMAVDIMTYEQVYLFGMWALHTNHKPSLKAMYQLQCGLLSEKIASYFYFRDKMDIVKMIIPEQFLEDKGWLWNDMKDPPPYDTKQLLENVYFYSHLTFL